MSWDIFVQDIPEEIVTIEDLQKFEDYQPKLVGKRFDVIAKIKEVVPEADFSDPSWGKIEGPDYSIEVSMGDDQECYGFALHVLGGDTAAFIVADIIEHLGLRAFNPNSDNGMFKIDPELVDGFKRWKKYRDYVLRRKEEK